MMKLLVLCCAVAVVAANVPYYVAPVGITVPSSIGYAVPLQYPYNSAHLAIKSLDNGVHALKKRSVTRLAVAPGPVGFSAALAAGNVGISAPISVDLTGFSAAIATNPIGITGPLTTGPIGISTPIVAGSAAVSVPIAGVTPLNARTIGISTSPISSFRPIAVSAPIATGTGVDTSPIAVGSTVSASAVPVVRTF